jgi:hypothetical protein
MGRHEKIIQAEPPAPRANAVLLRRQASEQELAVLNAEIGERALSAIEGKPGGKDGLAALHDKIRAVTFEIECNAAAHELALRLDQEAIAAWKTAIYAMPPESLIAGITAKDCCRLCSADHGCVITAGGQCGHPVKIGVLDPHSRGVPMIRAAYQAATAKLKLKGHG